MPQLSVTVTTDEAREIQERAGSETVSNYVRGRLGLPALARGRSGRQNDEVTRQASENDLDRHIASAIERHIAEVKGKIAALRTSDVALHSKIRSIVEAGDDSEPDAAGEEAHELAYEPVED